MAKTAGTFQIFSYYCVRPTSLSFRDSPSYIFLINKTTLENVAST